ncbi:MAG: hypothetical protein PHY56_00925 [Candidatus Omnitrophica bacterium]|jgi:hypothetical protein|nr:hypothetical protein [Candidatus Omnitrophota bacterium]
MVNLKEAFKREDGESGFDVLAQIKAVFKPKEGKYGESQAIVVQDLEDSKASCYMYLNKDFLTEGDKGSVFTFHKCKKSSYEKDGETKPSFNCHGGWSNGKAETHEKPGAKEPVATSEPLPTAAVVVDENKMTKGEWQKKDLLMARESVMKSATAIVAAQVAAGFVSKELDLMEYACRMADFFENYVYNGYKPKEEPAPVEPNSLEMEKRLAVIRMIQTAQNKYEIPLEEIMRFAVDKFGYFENLQDLDSDKLNKLLADIIDEKVLHRPKEAK